MAKKNLFMLKLRKTVLYDHLSVVKLVYNGNLGTPNLWLLLTGGRFLEVAVCYKNRKLYFKIVVHVEKWSLFGGGQ